MEQPGAKALNIPELPLVSNVILPNYFAEMAKLSVIWLVGDVLTY